ncbi:TetR family transcriptional regulator [Tepidanaerobacter syntrophicus]|uniref:TetR family transcriptional regulator n=1 Tax=Tepidanaerobacter syntrophicus TaxID=224999 RepID=UPI001BD6DD73|nr:TetR family transcriptional regulator [Tepidanaerobacter syntrophicus]
MRKTKEDAEETKNNILKVAIEIFFKYGYENATLEQISKAAGVTRGAVYWHFENKQNLFKCTIQSILEEISEAKRLIISKYFGDHEKIISNLLWLPREMTMHFQYIEKALLSIDQSDQADEFEEIVKDIVKTKLRLYYYFLEELRQAKMYSNSQLENKAVLLYTIFEGMYSCNIPEEIDSKISKNLISNFVNQVI